MSLVLVNTGAPSAPFPENPVWVHHACKAYQLYRMIHIQYHGRSQHSRRERVSSCLKQIHNFIS